MAESISSIIGPLRDRRCLLCKTLVRNASPRLKYCYRCYFKIAEAGGIRKYRIKIMNSARDKEGVHA